MGMTASRKLKDLRSAGRGFIVFGLLAPNIFATLGILVAHGYAYLTHAALPAGNLCAVRGALRRGLVHRRPGGAAAGDPRGQSDPAAGRSLGLTFSYNVTIGIPLYIEIATHGRALVSDHLNAPSTHPASSCRHEMSANHPRPQSELVPPRPCGANAPFGAVSKADRSRAVAVPATVGNDSAQPIQCRVVYGSVLFVHSDAVKLWGIGS